MTEFSFLGELSIHAAALLPLSPAEGVCSGGKVTSMHSLYKNHTEHSLSCIHRHTPFDHLDQNNKLYIEN